MKCGVINELVSAGLAMSRAIGDVLAASVGVTAVPEISYVMSRT